MNPPDGGGPWHLRGTAAVALLLLTAVAGALDATAFLFMGGTFVSAQTGTVLLLAMNLSGNHAVDTGAAVTSLGCFVLGASICGALVRQPEPGRRWPSRAPQVVTAEALLVLLSATVGWQIDPHPAWLVAPLAVAMGMQSTVARRLGLTYLTGGYITGGLTAGALGSPLGDRSSRSWWYAGLPVGAMALGAVGAAFVATRRLTLAVILVAALAGVASALIWHAPAVGPDPDD